MSRVKVHDCSKISSTPVIGWVGTAVTQCYLKDLAPELVKLKKRRNFVLRVISNVDFEYEGLDTENIRWSKDTEYEEIRKFDVGIMPLTQDPFSEGKASYKLLQYMASGVPSVASAVGMNVDVADNNKNAMLASDYMEFVKNIELILSDSELRKKLSANGKKLIAEKYSTEVTGEQLASVIYDFFQRTLAH
jgi:glycosyltransferase involved in cell wall biosynthesis